MGQKCEGNCGLWVLNEILKKHILKIWKKSWVPFGSYLLDSTADSAQFEWKLAGLAVLFRTHKPQLPSHFWPILFLAYVVCWCCAKEFKCYLSCWLGSTYPFKCLCVLIRKVCIKKWTSGRGRSNNSSKALLVPMPELHKHIPLRSLTNLHYKRKDQKNIWW